MNERAPEKVAADVACGYYTVEQAERRYGVRLAADGTPDAEATARLRGRLRAA